MGVNGIIVVLLIHLIKIIIKGVNLLINSLNEILKVVMYLDLLLSKKDNFKEVNEVSYEVKEVKMNVFNLVEIRDFVER